MGLAILVMLGGGYLAFKSKKLGWKILGVILMLWGFAGIAHYS